MIGFDLQEVDRLKNPQKLLEKISLESEAQYIQKFKKSFKERVATLWAVKEAAFKALQGDEQISFKEIELKHKENGAPYLKLHGKALERLRELGFSELEVSISHQKSIVGAVVIAK